MNITVINGPNLNLLGTREPDIYGRGTYPELVQRMKQFGSENGIEFTFVQSSSEGELVDAIHAARDQDGLIINPGAYSHYSIAILDALRILEIPKVEVHLSHVHDRESFRRNLITAQGCDASITGMGFVGYTLAATYLLDA